MLALVKDDLGNGHTASTSYVLWAFFGLICFGFCLFGFFYIVYICLSLSSFPSSASGSVPCLSIGPFMGLLAIMHTCPAI